MSVWRNWPVHNLIAHPLSEVVYWIVRPWSVEAATTASKFIHDASLPK